MLLPNNVLNKVKNIIETLGGGGIERHFRFMGEWGSRYKLNISVYVSKNMSSILLLYTFSGFWLFNVIALLNSRFWLMSRCWEFSIAATLTKVLKIWFIAIVWIQQCFDRNNVHMDSVYTGVWWLLRRTLKKLEPILHRTFSGIKKAQKSLGREHFAS